MTIYLFEVILDIKHKKSWHIWWLSCKLIHLFLNYVLEFNYDFKLYMLIGLIWMIVDLILRLSYKGIYSCKRRLIMKLLILYLKIIYKWLHEFGE